MAVWVTLFALASAAPNLVMISLDTTRADALSCYGPPGVAFYDATPEQPRTPVLDGVAKRGLRFDRFYAQSPSTLASHATMFSGKGPHGTRVPRNGFPVPTDLPLLAERLKQAGYQTHGVIAAAALEPSTGIGRGFDTWDAEYPHLQGIMYQAPANEVVDRVNRLTSTISKDPLFLFVHLFDAHAPYTPRSPYGERFQPPGPPSRYADPESHPREMMGAIRDGTVDVRDLQAVNGRYYAELLWMDAQIGRLLHDLRGKGLLDDALVVVVGDHGEVLSEHAGTAWTHGNSVSEGVMRVPLLLEATGTVVLGRGVVPEPAAMEDLAPTLERLLGLEVTLGEPLWNAVRAGPVQRLSGWPDHPTRPVFQEATRPRGAESKDAWNNLPMARGVQVGDHRMDRRPLANQVRVSTGAEPLRDVLEALLNAWDATAPPHQSHILDDQQIRSLKALGYLSDDEDDDD